MKSLLLVLLTGSFLCFYSCGERLVPSSQLIELNTEGPIRGAYFFDADHGFVAGGERFTETLLQSTQDAGQSWTTRLPEPVFDQTLFDICFYTEAKGVACGIGGKYLYTQDSGESWQVVQSQYWRQMQGIAYADSLTIVSVGGNGYASGIIERSTNGGLNWTLVDTFDFELRDVAFVNENVGFACGYGVILKTLDGGLNWDFTEAKKEFFSALSFPTADLGYAVGRTGSILRTTDQGESWERLRNGNLATLPAHRYHDVCFIDAENGYVVGDKGLVMRTRDGGESWQKFKLGTESDWWHVEMMQSGESVLCGTNGNILWLDE